MSNGIGATMIQTPRRNVLRKLVQSMMLPHKPEEVVESNRDRKCDAGEKEEGEAGDGDSAIMFDCFGEDYVNVVSLVFLPTKMAKGKSPRKSTPKKNATKNGIVATADDHINVSPSLPNLRLEAKLRAEVRRFADVCWEATTSLFLVLERRIKGKIKLSPSVLSMYLKAFHEYASYIGHISRANPSNLSGAMENSRRRRSKESRHYLSMDLSSEDIAFLGQQNTYRREEMNN
ncbi:hypothetical protein HID58_008032 [Brassica napus]|uniref:Uncharacterized protein n=1 Tax=Brassica napus TaxID=3708 RepID=A0ABQ7XK07_BRANA|nr:hypothetical protein HID58_008032 [Brassica napus]